MHEDTQHTLINGAIGMLGSLFAVISTFQHELEWWIRTSGGLLGLIIALITLCNMICKWFKKDK